MSALSWFYLKKYLFPSNKGVLTPKNVHQSGNILKMLSLSSGVPYSGYKKSLHPGENVMFL